jgi:hypothetical protein
LEKFCLKKLINNMETKDAAQSSDFDIEQEGTRERPEIKEEQ